MGVTATNGLFQRDGKPFFLVSGEIHYFRLNPRHWEKHLRLLKESGANTTSTYVPWDWHEPREGEWDFSGSTHPARNLLRYIELCKNVGLDLIIKPGPYILAEYEHHGIPEWLVRREDKEALALDAHGGILAHDRMSYMSEAFLRYTFSWYDKIMPIIAAHQTRDGGPITMMQVCNEVGVFQWLSGSVDYSPSVAGLYRQYLRELYGSVDKLNGRYGTRYNGFDEIVPPAGVIGNRLEYRVYYDFHRFYRRYFALYIDTLVKRIRSYGIDVLLTHNVPGWIYGSASELPMLLSTYADVSTINPEIVFGLDHIPESVSYRNAHADLACNKFLEAVQPNNPVWAAEFQAGSREHHVKNDAADMEMFYTASLAHGLKGFNYYMFSQGINQRGKGVFGKTFYFQTPLDATARKSPLFDVAKTVGRFIRREGEDLLKSSTAPQLCVAYYRPYYYTDMTSSQLLRERKLAVEKLGLTLDPRFVREHLLFDGALRALQTLNINYDIRDLQNSEVDALLKYRQLWVVTTEFMDKETQEFLLAYVKRGGHLVIFPAMPTLDDYLGDCTVLCDGLGLHVGKIIAPNKVDALGIEDVYSTLKEQQEFVVSEREAIAHTKTGSVNGIRRKVGEGTVTVLGFAFGYTTDEHLQLFEKIAGLGGVKSDRKASDPDIQVVVRHGRKHSYMFLLNYHNATKAFTVASKRYSLRPFSCKVVRIN